MGPRSARHGRIAAPEEGSMDAHDVNAANAEARSRLAALVASLHPDDLRRSTGDWTVAATLVHLSFWDRWQVVRWTEAVHAGAVAPPLVPDGLTDLINDTLAPVLDAVPPERAGALALAAAEAVDTIVAGLPEASIRAVAEQGRPRTADRSRHRLEHIAQIERALGRASA